MVFPVVMYGCESWPMKKGECQRIDAFELWCWRRLYTWTSPDGQHRNLIMFFADKDGEALYSQQKQDQELTVAQTMNSLLPNSYLN